MNIYKTDSKKTLQAMISYHLCLKQKKHSKRKEVGKFGSGGSRGRCRVTNRTMGKTDFGLFLPSQQKKNKEQREKRDEQRREIREVVEAR
jgi:hypothetical protein